MFNLFPPVNSPYFMKNLLVAALSLLCLNASAQTDSVTLVKTDWKTERIAPGIKLKKAWFNKNLFASNQNISIVEIRQRRRNQLKIGYEPKKLIPTSEFGKRDAAIAAINGTFFDIRNGGSVDFLKAGGTVINENRLNKDGSRAIHQKAALVINDGRLGIKEWNGEESWEKSLAADEIMLTGPLLMLSGEPRTMDSTLFVTARHPRSAVATRGRKIYFITVDGRQENAAGMSLPELRNVVKWLKLKDAVNLDGGGSTTLWVRDQPETGVVNYPSDNKKWDHHGERKVANVVLVKRRSRR
jgi:exopolysaccharide biosynthesis protein